jgi:hypothetical protein
MRSGNTMKTLALVPLFLITAAVFTGNANDGKGLPEDVIRQLAAEQRVIEVKISQPSDLGRIIDQKITILDADASTVKALVSPGELEWLRGSGFETRVIYESLAEMWGWKDNPAMLRQFHDYWGMKDELEQIAADYPHIAKLYNLGKSVQGKVIWGLKVTDNPDVEENEAEVRICGLHHGDELMSAEMPINLSWYLVENYSSDPYITELVDERETWIIPMVNPDGRMSGPDRYNANWVDLNRDYGYMWDGEGHSPAPFSQPETRAIRSHALENNFVLSLSFHCSGDIVNYVWNYTPTDVPDKSLVVQLSEAYADVNGYWVVEGYDWYQVHGDTNDFSYGCRGDIDWTIEIQSNNIPNAWDKNRESILEIIEAAGKLGIEGIVTDSVTGEPLAATVWVEEAYWPSFTDPEVGDYHRLLLPGTYNVHYRANGYEEQVHVVSVGSSGDPTVLDVTLVPGDDYYGYQVTSCRFYDPYSFPNNYQNNRTNAISALGPQDGTFASLGKGGDIVIDMGAYGRITNESGSDFTVHEAPGAVEGYTLYVSNNWNGPWTSMGTGSGTTSFDLETVSYETARFVKIVDDNNGSAYDTNPGFDLDAIESHNPPRSTVHVDNEHAEFYVLSGSWNSRNHPDAYEGTTRFTSPGTGSNKVAWRVDGVVVPGTYEVYTWKFEHDYSSSMATNAHYKVRDKDSTSDWILVDQSTPGNEWKLLGTFEFDDRFSQGVMLTDEADGYVIADAMRLIKID